MKKRRILALDMGGTAVKWGLYNVADIRRRLLLLDGLEVDDGYSFETRGSWTHDYRDCGIEEAKTDLIRIIREFCFDKKDKKVDAVGLGIAGLIATDGSLYRSTVVTSFVGFNIPEFLRQELAVDIVTIDNDADCGAIREQKECKGRLFYVVVGSGIGSAYIDIDGNLPYLTRFDPKHKFSDTDNPIPNDLGLRVAVPKTHVYAKLKEYEVKREIVERILVDKDGKPLNGFNNDADSIRVGNLGSAIGLKKLFDIITADIKLSEWRRDYKDYLFSLSNEKRAAKTLSNLAKDGDQYALTAFEIFGYFLGYGIAEAQKVIRSEQQLHEFPDVHLGGPIMDSLEYFKQSMEKAISEREVSCELMLATNLAVLNVDGAYLRASQALGR